MKKDQALTRLKEIDKEIVALEQAGAVLGWDQQVMMPGKAVEERAATMSFIGKLAHERVSSDELGDVLSALGARDDNKKGEGLSEWDGALVRALYREHKQATKIPVEVVSRFIEATARGHRVWEEARKNSDFASFAPELETIVGIRREMAEHLGYDESPYDALLDQFEPELKTKTVAAVFDELQTGLVDLIGRIKGVKQVDDAAMRQAYDATVQEQLGLDALKAIGFDMERGRLDVSTHPFTQPIADDDVRLTTRYYPDYLGTGLFGILHEGGHGMYEQNFGPDVRGTSLADGTSLGIHESLSRFWENVVGRSRAFWEYFYPTVKKHFPAQASSFDAEAFYKSACRVSPSLIRVDADEVTYSLHVILRFRLERALIEGDLAIADLPGAWNDLMDELLGVRPENDAQGVLQDVHWSAGHIGYFPTYALGNVYGLQFVEAMKGDIGDLGSLIGAGNFAPIKGWLDTHIHAPGAGKTPEELIHGITGAAPSATHFLSYLNEKYADIYAL